jgi:hypothetical protein
VITGKIYDAASQKPMEYANVILLSQSDSVLVTGTTSGENGSFQINRIGPGTYCIDVQFIGYTKKRLLNIEVGPAKFEVDLGKILLQQAALRLEGVEANGEAMAMNYQIDKKVINVSQQQTAISGTAVEVLENIPSVTVDIEGNVSLRGSSNFSVLVDGRPAVLEPSEALQQIPASTIEKIEIITNPSAKYDAEGGSGIINVILKKGRRPGRSGMANLNAGFGNKYGGDFLYDYKNGDYHVTLGVDYNCRSLTGNDLEENKTAREGITSFIQSDGDSHRGDVSRGLRGEITLDLGRKDLLNFGMRYGERTSRRGSDLDYAEWIEPEIDRLLYISTTDRNRERNFYALTMFFQHRFAPKGHELSGEVSLSRRDAVEETTYGLLTSAGVIISGRRATEVSPSRDLRAKLDYTLALGKAAKFEAGYQSELDHSNEFTESHEYDPSQSEYVLPAQFSSQTRYNETIHALYAIFAGHWNRLEYQAGLRGEYADRAIEPQGAATRFVIKGWDYFPTLHLSHEFSAGHQAKASYARRIQRPSGGA